MLIVGIDVGIRNLALCALRDGVPEQWVNEPLVEGRYEPTRNVEYCMHFVQKHARLLAAADHVVIERQLRANMRCIEAVLHALHWGKCSIVHARTVKARYGLSRRDYRQNKQAAVEYVLRHAPPCAATERFQRCRKRDDLADAFLLALFYSEHPTEQRCQSARSSSPTPPPGAPSPSTMSPSRLSPSARATARSPSSRHSTSRI